MAGNERRKEPRFVVDAVNLIAGGRSYPIIDLSIRGARISCTPEEYEHWGNGPVELEFNRDGRREVIGVEPELIRKAELYVVLGFDPPRPNWNDFIRQFDTFHVQELDEQLFD